MISGPTLPGTRDAVWHLVQHRVDRLESGLKLAFHDLEVAPGVVIDGLCRDAATHPVAVLAAVASDGDSFVGQILAVRRFLREQAEGLGELLPEVRIQFTGQARVMVVGLEISAALRDAVEPLGGDGVELFQLHSVRLGGELRWMVQPVTGPQAGQARTAAGGPQTVPGGVLDPRQQGLCATFLRIAERLDPSVILRGDRFGRRVLCNGEQLAALSYIEGRLQVAFRDGAEVELLTEEDAMSAGDRLIRDFLAAAGVWNAGAAADGQPGRGRLDGLHRLDLGSGRQESPESLRDLQESILASRLTPEEGAALAGVEIWTPDLKR